MIENIWDEESVRRGNDNEFDCDINCGLDIEDSDASDVDAKRLTKDYLKDMYVRVISALRGLEVLFIIVPYGFCLTPLKQCAIAKRLRCRADDHRCSIETNAGIRRCQFNLKSNELNLIANKNICRQILTDERAQIVHLPQKLCRNSGNSALSLDNKLLLYTSLLKPIWTYGIQLWGAAFRSNINIIERLQSKCIRNLINVPCLLAVVHRRLVELANRIVDTALVRRRPGSRFPAGTTSAQYVAVSWSPGLLYASNGDEIASTWPNLSEKIEKLFNETVKEKKFIDLLKNIKVSNCNDANFITQTVSRALITEGFEVFDAYPTLQQPKDDLDNCGIWALLNIADILQMLQKQPKENRMTAACWAQRAPIELKKAMRERNHAVLNCCRRTYAAFLDRCPAYDNLNGLIYHYLIAPKSTPPPAKSKAVASLLAKMKSTTANVGLVELEPESPSTPATKELKSITGRPAPSTIRSMVRPTMADRKRPSADTQQEEVVTSKQRRSDLELLYNSEDDEPITSRARIFNRLVSSSSSSDVE
ncbi:unnamed protein product [Trichogramma brassicae]|uniref:Uncharacterized protein n=1 Tax=Trichogramma brassicae TaxID=86971 RepID=A0A6H5IN10_9HYME|nr:unnamed protein product [Trichogramma brassicae]